MRASSLLAQAEAALAEGDLPRARAIVDAVLAEKPRHAGALDLRRTIEELEPFYAPEEVAALQQDFGDLRPDARHVMAPALAPPSVAYDPRAERPLGVAILAILDVLVGAATLLLGLLVGGPIGLFLDILGAVALASGVGLWRLRPWAWTLSLVATTFAALLNLAEGLRGDGRSLVLALLQGGILAYLWVVREHFRAPAPTRSPPRRSQA